MSDQRSGVRRLMFVLGTVTVLTMLVLFGVNSGGCARVAEHKVEDRVNALLPRYLGQAQKYKTHITSAGVGSVLRGRLKSVHVDGTGVQLEPALLLDSLTLDIADVDVDTKAGVVRSVGNATFACRIREESLNRYARSQRNSVPDLAVALRGDRVIVSARPEILGIGAPVSVEGSLLPRSGGAYINFEPDKAKVSIVPVPGLVLDYLSRRLNPLLDLSALHIPIRVERAEIRGGALMLSGTVSADELLKASGK